MFFEEIVKDGSLLLPEGYTATVRLKKEYKEDLGHFTPTSWIKHKESSSKNKDWIDIMDELPKAAWSVLRTIKNYRCWKTNIATVEEWHGLSKDKKRPINHNINKLKDAGLLLKVKPVENILTEVERDSYMINPYWIKPSEYFIATHLWKSFGGKPMEDTYAI